MVQPFTHLRATLQAMTVEANPMVAECSVELVTAVLSQQLSVHRSRTKELHMSNKARVSAASGVVIALLSALVASGVLSNHTVSIWQPVVVAAITFGATVGIRSARP